MATHNGKLGRLSDEQATKVADEALAGSRSAAEVRLALLGEVRASGIADAHARQHGRNRHAVAAVADRLDDLLSDAIFRQRYLEDIAAGMPLHAWAEVYSRNVAGRVAAHLRRVSHDEEE